MRKRKGLVEEEKVKLNKNVHMSNLGSGLKTSGCWCWVRRVKIPSNSNLVRNRKV